MKLYIAWSEKFIASKGRYDLLKSPRPGPDYYSECKRFSWIKKIRNAHRSHLKSQGIERPEWYENYDSLSESEKDYFRSDGS